MVKAKRRREGVCPQQKKGPYPLRRKMTILDPKPYTITNPNGILRLLFRRKGCVLVSAKMPILSLTAIAIWTTWSRTYHQQEHVTQQKHPLLHLAMGFLLSSSLLFSPSSLVFVGDIYSRDPSFVTATQNFLVSSIGGEMIES